MQPRVDVYASILPWGVHEPRYDGGHVKSLRFIGLVIFDIYTHKYIYIYIYIRYTHIVIYYIHTHAYTHIHIHNENFRIM